MAKKKKSNKITKSMLNDLQLAVNRFNNTISKLEKEKTKILLPNKVNFNELKKLIITEKQFTRELKALRSFNLSDINRIVTLETGEKITEYQHRQNLKNRQIALATLNEEILKIDDKEKVNPSIMGNKKLKSLTSTMNTLLNYNTIDMSNYRYIERRLKNIGSLDYKKRKLQVYRDNFLFSIQGLQNYPSKKIIYRYLKNITDLEKFYEITQNTNVLKEIFIYYKEPEITLFDFDTQEEMIEYALSELNIDEKEIEKFKKSLKKKVNE